MHNLHSILCKKPTFALFVAHKLKMQGKYAKRQPNETCNLKTEINVNTIPQISKSEKSVKNKSACESDQIIKSTEQRQNYCLSL